MDNCGPRRDDIYVMVASSARPPEKKRHPFIVWLNYGVEHTWSILPFVLVLFTVPPVLWKILCACLGWD